MESASRMSRVKKPKVTSSVTIIKDKSQKVDEKLRKDSHKREQYQKKLDTKKLRESVLNKLWDSVPPETRILPHSNDEDSDSTQSGLDEEEFEGEKKNGKDGTTECFNDLDNSLEFTNKQIEDDISEVWISNDGDYRDPKSCAEKTEDSTISWETNLDFVQSIIWLKSTTARLQRVPVDEFLGMFQNQWDLSPKITLEQKQTDFSSSSRETRQLEKIDLIKNRLATVDANLGRRNHRDIVIPESDESESPSLQSSQCAPDQHIANRVSESMGFSNVDSGFGSDKPDSAEVTNPSQSLIKNLGKRERPDNYHSKTVEIERENLRRSNPVSGLKHQMELISAGCSSGENPPAAQSKKRNFTWLKKHCSISGEASIKRPKLSISSAVLNYVLRSSECHQVLLGSVQPILEVLENGSCDFGNHWYDLVQKEAINAVVEVVDLLEKEKGPNSCRNEVVTMVKRVLEKMLNSSNVDRLTAWEHHRLVILELCNAPSVCVEVLNYLISELKELIPVAIQTTEENMRVSVMVMDKSYILFHSLKVAVKKYKTFTPTPVVTSREENASEKISEVTDLWKRHWKATEKLSDIFVTALKMPKIPDDPEKLWAAVLEELVVVSTRIWPMVKILAWQCLALLKSPASSPARDG